MSDWSDTKEILREVEQLFQRDDDLLDIQDISKMETEINVYYGNNLKDLKEKIKVLTSNLAVKEAQISTPTEAEHTNTLKRYMERKDEIQTKLNHLRDQIDLKRDTISNTMNNISNLKQQIVEYNSNLQLQDSRTAYAISLYSKISHITWNYGGSSTRLTGHVMNDKKSEINPFDIDASRNQFEITNSLWDVIGQSLE